MASTRALLLVRHAPTSATRAASFPADEALDARGRAAAGRLAATLPARADALTSPARSCRETADAAGLEAARVEAALADVDYGAWAGRTLDDVQVGEPDAAAAWVSDPDARPHGGETLRELAGRVEAWLATQAALEGRAVAITHAAVVRAAVVHALGAPPAAFWRIDVPPLAVTELHARSGRWTLARLSCGDGDRRR
jgi:broad specificity phosphatase PhoE